MRISTTSTEYVRVPVAALDDTGALVNPTANVVQIAFTASEGTAPSSWNAATWETSENVRVSVGTYTIDTPYKARLLVGPGETVLAAGRYAVWVKVTESPEIPVRFSGYLTVY